MPFECFEHRGVGPGLGLDDVEEVARVDFGLFLKIASVAD